MAITYTCRHCSQLIGSIEKSSVDSSSLGFDQLTEREKQEMIVSQTNGDLVVYAICDDCTSALREHPQYHELDYFIQ